MSSTLQTSSISSVVVAQLGARDHYAFARAFQSLGICAGLVTDFWWNSSMPLPGGLGSRMQSRFHPDLAGIQVGHSNFASVIDECRLRLSGRDRWATIRERNERFQKRALSHLQAMEGLGERPCLFAYSYAARDLFRWAKKEGWRTILGQIDPGPVEDRLIQNLRQSRPAFGDPRQAAPAEYYADWREEVELADAVMVNSGWSEQALSEEGVEASKIRVVSIPYSAPRKIPPHQLPSQFTAERPLSLLFLGQVNLRKGIAELLEAMEVLQDRPLRLHVVGPSQITIPVRYQQLANTTFSSSVPRADVKSYLGEADLFVLPTHSDGFGLTQLESLGAGVPVLTSKNCSRVVEDGKTGRVLNEVSGEAIATALREILDAPESLARWTDACGVPESCGIDEVARCLESLVKGL